MKILLQLVLLLSISAAQAQIGIGTTDPQETLHIEGDLFIEGVGDVQDSMALVGADDEGTLTTLELDDNLLIENNKLSLIRSTTFGIGDMDISGVIILANFVHDLDLQLGPGEVNEGKTVIKIFGAPANIKLTGIQDGVDGMHLFFYHIGSTNVQFMDQSDTNSLLSAPQNRINVLAGSEVISGQGSVEMIYDGTSQRWLFLSIHD